MSLTPTTKKKKRKKLSGPSKSSSQLTKKGKSDDDTQAMDTVVGQSGKTKDSSELQELTKREMLTSPSKEDVQPKPDSGGKKTLRSLLMQTGSLDDLIKEGNTWPGIAEKLKDDFLGYQKSLSKDAQASYIADLGTVYYKYGEKAAIKQDPENAKYTKQIEPTVAFLEKFMIANGQWGYITEQDWFTKGDYVIGIDMNYYPDRSGFNPDSPKFHKDTGGNNIFVNLVFDNTKPIEATEWIPDPVEPSVERSEWQKKLQLPASHLKELELSRAELRKEVDETTEVTGGVTSGKNSYVSWVDDLIWHSSPTSNPRIEHGTASAVESYKNLSSASKGKEFSYVDQRSKARIIGAEVLATMAESPDTDLAKWLKSKGLGPQDVTVAVAKTAWKELYEGEEGARRYTEDATKRGRSPWRLTGEYSESNAYDYRLKNSTSISETPVGLSKRRRANSLDKNQGPLREAREASKGEARSFLRTWVRILPKDSTELAGVKFG